MATLSQTGNPETWLELGLRFYDAVDLKSCYDCFSKALQNTPDTDHQMKTEVHCWLGIVLDEMGQREEALKEYIQADNLDFEIKSNYSQFNLTITRDWIKKRIESPYTGSKKL